VAAELSTTVRLATDAAPHHDPDETQAAGIPVRGVGGHDATSRFSVPDEAIAPVRSLRARPVVEHAPARPAGDGGTQATRQVPTTTAPIPGPSGRTTAGPATSGAPPDAPAPEPGQAPRRRRGWLLAALVAGVAALAAVSFFLGLYTNGDTGGPSTASPDGPSAGRDPLRPVGVSSVTAFDPFGEEGENNDEAPLVLDGDPATRWGTLSYEGDPKFGGLKPGLGLVLDLGQTSDVARVTVGAEGSGTDLQVRAAPAGAGAAPAQPGDYTTVGTASDASGETPIRLDKPVSTRYLLVWLTELPPEPGGTFRGSISEITVEG
jgi:hypothetical protein